MGGVRTIVRSTLDRQGDGGYCKEPDNASLGTSHLGRDADPAAHAAVAHDVLS